jgi:hypothetical protein
MGIDREKLFRKLALENSFTTERAVRKAREYQGNQRARGAELSLGEALMELNLLNKTQYLTIQRAATYKIQRSFDKVLARILIESDYAPKGNVLESLVWQKEMYTRDGVCRPIGDLLIERNQLAVEQLKAAQKIQKLKG